MGNNASLPEKLYQSVVKNDLCSFQALVRDFGAGLDDPDARARVLEYKDSKGRTPLLLAAAKNHYQIMQELVKLGADVHYINPAPNSAGGALHEAASRRHEAAVELLLGAGANPFAANAAGRTALDEAVLSGHSGVVRAIERRAEFTGAVAFKPPPAAPNSAAGPYPTPAGPCLMASPLTLYQQQQAFVAAMRSPTSTSLLTPPPPPDRSPERPLRASTTPQLGSLTPRRQGGGAAGLGMPAPPAAADGRAQQAVGAGAVGPDVETLVGTGGQVIGETFIENMSALPGETDEDFAARLASAVSATSGRSQQTLFPAQQHAQQPQQQHPQQHHLHQHYPALAQPPQRSAASASVASADVHPPGDMFPNPLHQLQQQQPGASPMAPSPAGLINFQSDPGGLQPAAIAGARPVGQSSMAPPHQPPSAAGRHGGGGGGPLDDLDLDAVNELIAAEASAATARAEDEARAAAAVATAAASQPPPRQPPVPTWGPPHASPQASKQEAPSAPPADAHASPLAAARRRPSEPDAEAECVICLSAPKEVGLLHGDSVHRCVCRGCSAMLRVGMPCPLCRQTVERVLGVY
ncbi:hypothetical protein GPECTOR_563g588 [Gonium pectorale]|uniref:Uncharacterized protein n=1 Tax=Gonium pectorale TaxID=33097 RepID=A0A150FWA2_GONPE|nr:hypothetical protein GPECTOR_563g588 [Gonium pectorale]|eukprot:KXZ41310.1 hypothetical protein GPECTOR_563g588 [Gonium pectorale]